MEISEHRRHPADTKEFLAMWSAAKEEHFVQELVPLLPLLLGSPGDLSGKQTEDTARHLVRALHLAATADGGLHTAMDYLTKVVEAKGPTESE
jgi:hypothetical protein